VAEPVVTVPTRPPEVVTESTDDETTPVRTRRVLVPLTDL
jgi:hypothetical protein